MIAVSTAWNQARHAGWAPAVAEVYGLGTLAAALGGPSLHADAAAVRRLSREAGGEIVALFAPVAAPGDATRTDVLSSRRADTRAVAVRAAVAAAQAALAAGTRRVIVSAGEMPELDPSREGRLLADEAREGPSDARGAELAALAASAASGRDAFVEGLCRSLFDVARAAPDAEVLVLTPRSLFGLPTPHELELVFAELPGRRIGYWHDTAHAARLAALGGPSPAEWLARLGARTAGVSLADFAVVGDGPASGDGLPPGTGAVDWAGLRGQIGTSMSRVLRLDSAFPPQFAAEALRTAASLGF